MSERLTADELAEANKWLRRGWFTGGKHYSTEIRTDLLDKLIAAAEEAQRLRAAIERHKEEYDCGNGTTHDQKLWEALK